MPGRLVVIRHERLKSVRFPSWTGESGDVAGAVAQFGSRLHTELFILGVAPALLDGSRRQTVGRCVSALHRTKLLVGQQSTKTTALPRSFVAYLSCQRQAVVPNAHESAEGQRTL